MVAHPDPEAESATAFEYDRGDDGMPDRTRRAFQSHADQQLTALPEQTKRDIERVYRRDRSAVVGCSGGKDSMVVLALAAQADCEHRVFHWDWGSRLIPRPVERELVENIREFVPDERLFVASRSNPTVTRYPNADEFQYGLTTDDGIQDSDGSLDRLAGALGRSEDVGRQLVGLRAGESGKRKRKLSESGLFGRSLGQPAAFPLRDWSARDVWAYIVDREVPYPRHYDRIAVSAGDGSPEAYEDARFTTFFDPEFEALSGGRMGIAEWRYRGVETR